jgi:GxxExxY protein
MVVADFLPFEADRKGFFWLCVKRHSRKVVVELKAVDALEPSNEAQLLNYLKAMCKSVDLLINFGSSVTIKRMVL